MSHRYGRHGPRAWVRWHKRHQYVSTLPALVTPMQPEIRVIRVRIPIGISSERIIYIIMSNNGDFVATSEGDPRDGDSRSLQHYSSSVPSLPETGSRSSAVSVAEKETRSSAESVADTELRESAKIAAGRDLRSFTRMIDDGKMVYVNRKLLDGRSEDLADQKLEEYIKRYPNITSEEYDRLVSVYRKAYMGRITNDIGEISKNRASDVVWWLSDKKEAELREIAIRNREEIRPIGSDNRVGYHRRDLGMLHVMDLYDITVQQALSNIEDLKTVHTLTDKYDDFQKKAGNEVIWPTEATFQER